MKTLVLIVLAAVVVAYFTKAYMWVALGTFAIWVMLYGYARLSSDPDAKYERWRLAQIEKEMREEGTWGDYEALRLKNLKYPKRS